MIVALAAFLNLATACAPAVAVETLAAVAQHESRFDDTAIHDNTAKRAYAPLTREEALALATQLIVAQHHSVDLGLMQINSETLASLGLSISDAFDDCRNVAAGARVLAEAYTPPPPGSDTQPRLLQALSRYNTGNPERGFTNGYVAQVQNAAEVVVPAIRLNAEAREPPGTPPAGSPSPASSLPPAWDVFGQALAARARQNRPPPPSPSTPPAPPERMAETR